MARSSTGGARSLTEAQARQRLVAGTWRVAVDGDNYRNQFVTLPEAEATVAEAGFSRYDSMYAIVAVPRHAERWTARRESLSDLSPATQRRYRGSVVAQAEARAHGVTIDQWYRVAPTVRAFRGHAPDRRQRPGESEEEWEIRLAAGARADLGDWRRWGNVDFAYYLRPGSDATGGWSVLSRGQRQWFTRDVRAAAVHRRTTTKTWDEAVAARERFEAITWDAVTGLIGEAAELPGEALEEP